MRAVEDAAHITEEIVRPREALLLLRSGLYQARDMYITGEIRNDNLFAVPEEFAEGGIL